MLPIFNSAPSPTLAVCAALFGLGLAALSPDSRAAESRPAANAQTGATAADATASYKDVDLRSLVEKSKTEIPGQRIIFAPSPVRFRAKLSAMPAPQKSDYLMAALAMMKVSAPPKVSQRIGLDYGGDKGLAAYIDDALVDKLKQDAKPGQMLTFYAFHVYNNNRGPALLVTSFSE